MTLEEAFDVIEPDEQIYLTDLYFTKISEGIKDELEILEDWEQWEVVSISIHTEKKLGGSGTVKLWVMVDKDFRE